jgi:hypothetical protein
VIERLLRTLAIVLSLNVAVGFVLFAVDDFARASNESRALIAGNVAPDPLPRAEREREQVNSRAREYVDDANDILLRPFTGLVANASSRWAQRGITTLLGLLVYGFLLGFFARYARGRGGRPATDRRPQVSRS